MSDLDEIIKSLTREQAINLVISSIAMEEIGLSHVINSEGEKLQCALGTLEGGSKLAEPVTVDELLAVNKSIRGTLETTMRNQMLLGVKLQNAINAPTMRGPVGAVGTILGSYDSLEELEEAHPAGKQGDAYLVVGELYVWNVDLNMWQAVGNLMGPAGKLEEGQKLFTVSAAEGSESGDIVCGGDLEFKSDTLEVTLEPNAVRIEKPYSAGLIIPYNSGDVLTLTTSITGTAYRKVIIGRGESDFVTTTAVQINTASTSDLSLLMPVKGTVKALSVYFSLATNTGVIWPNAQTLITAQLFLSPYPSSNTFTPIDGAFVSFTIPFTTLAGAIYQGHIELNIPLQARDRLLLVFYSSSAPSYAAGSTISGRASASIKIE